jgi:hypothetical protein
MSDEEIDALVSRIDEMARRIGCRFIPDPEKLLAFRCAQRAEREMRAYYRKAVERAFMEGE